MDRTALIRVVEETGKQVIINRPPRFGKSLHLETCFWYYDKSVSEEKRNELFEGTDIGANPTHPPERPVHRAQARPLGHKWLYRPDS